MVERWISWFLGYVEFSLTGRYPERFFSLAAAGGVRIWHMEGGERFSGRMSIRDYRALRPLARRCRVKARIRKKAGFPFFMRRVLKRKGLAAGFFLFIAVYLFLSSYIWSVDVQGNRALAREEVLEAVRACGLVPGTLKSHVDPGEIENRLMRSLPELSWVSVNTYGCAVSVAIKEKVEAPEIRNTEAPANLIAACPGQITGLEIFGGEARVKVGDGVAKGELLVSGVVQIGENTVLKHSFGQVWADTVHELSVSVPKNQGERVLLESTVNRCSARVFGLQIPLSFAAAPKGNWQKSVTEEPLKIGDVILPLSLLKETWTPYEIVQRAVSRKEAEAMAEELLDLRFREVFPQAEILSKIVQVSASKNAFIVTWHTKCSENIAVEAEILENWR